MTKQRIGILGLGAIGSVMASLLHMKGDSELFGFNRSKVTEIHVKKKDDQHQFPINCITNTNEPISLDWLIICIKSYHYYRAKTWFEQLIGNQTRVVIIRNGLDLSLPLLPYCSKDRLLECLIDCPTERISNRIFHQLRAAKLTCPNSSIANQFEVLLPDSGVELIQVEDFITASWKKLIESSALGAITCLSGETAWIFQQKNLQRLFLELVEEALVVARADGAELEPEFMVELLEKVRSYPPDKGSSMLTDRLQGRPIELEAKSGAIVTTGRKLGIKTPLHQMVCTLLQATNMKR